MSVPNADCEISQGPEISRLPVQSTPTGPTFSARASYAQERIWFASSMAAAGALYVVSDEMCLGVVADPTVVVRALETVVGRHESLRTTLELVDGTLMQKVYGSIRTELLVRDYRDCPLIDTTERLVADCPYPNSLYLPPLWTATLTIVTKDDWRLRLVVHHAVTDAASVVILRAEIAELCAASSSGREPQLPELAVQYPDYAAWHHQQLAAQLPELDAFWDKTLHELPAVHSIPTDRPRGVERSYAGGQVHQTRSREILDAVAATAREHRCTDFTVLAAAYIATLARWSRSSDIVIGLPVTGRDRPELQSVVGMFVNMVILRVDTSGDPSGIELLARTKTAVFSALEHQQMPLQRVVQRHASGRVPGAPPLYQLMFNFLQMEIELSQDNAAEDDIACEIGLDSRGDFLLRFDYNSALFERETIVRLAQDTGEIMQMFAMNPSKRLSELPVSPMLLPQSTVGSAGDADAGSDASAPSQVVSGEPSTEIEELVIAVWSELLERSNVQRDDEFFASGGHSLLALRVIGRLRDATGVDLTIQDFFADTTVRGVARQIEQLLIDQVAALTDDQARQMADLDD